MRTFGLLMFTAALREPALIAIVLTIVPARWVVASVFATPLVSASMAAEAVAVAACSSLPCCWRDIGMPLGVAWCAAGASLAARLLYCQSRKPVSNCNLRPVVGDRTYHRRTHPRH